MTRSAPCRLQVKPICISCWHFTVSGHVSSVRTGRVSVRCEQCEDWSCLSPVWAVWGLVMSQSGVSCVRTGRVSVRCELCEDWSCLSPVWAVWGLVMSIQCCYCAPEKLSVYTCARLCLQMEEFLMLKCVVCINTLLWRTQCQCECVVCAG